VTTAREAYVSARARLRAAGIDDANFEAELLLRHALGLGVNRAALLTRLAEQVALEQGELDAFEALLLRRLNHEPSAYILGTREFYRLDIEVTPAVLIPRPETETVVDEAIRLARIRHAGSVVDVGTGSGAIALALARALPDAAVIATDVSPEALVVARQNAARHGVEKRIAFLQGDLLAPLTQPVDLLVANLPYVTSSDLTALQPEVRDYEPSLALDGGADGLDLVRRLLADATSHLRPHAVLVLEIGAAQGPQAAREAAAAMPAARITVLRDLGGYDRVLVIET
jgi:release factor glutamine methyltransferase